MGDERKKQYDAQYKKDKIKRIPLEVQLTGEGLTYELLQMVANSKGEKINTFIKQACIERIERILRRE